MEKRRNQYVFVEIPTKVISRFLILPSAKDKKFITLLDDVIRYNLDEIFSIFDYDQIES